MQVCTVEETEWHFWFTINNLVNVCEKASSFIHLRSFKIRKSKCTENKERLCVANGFWFIFQRKWEPNIREWTIKGFVVVKIQMVWQFKNYILVAWHFCLTFFFIYLNVERATYYLEIMDSNYYFILTIGV